MDPSAFTLDAEELPSMSIRYTPLPAADSDDATQCSLDGTWLFAPGSPEEPPDDEADWRRHEVPGQWNHAGYEVPDGQRGWYRRSISIPHEWADRRVKLRFDGIYSDAIVLVDGTEVGTHTGGYTPVECDITEAVDPGTECVLHVGVREYSEVASMTQWSLGGGITRDVTLFAVPRCHVAGLDLTTTVDDDLGTVRASVTLGGPAVPEGARLRLTVDDPDGECQGVASVDGAELATGPPADATDLEVRVPEPETWDPERPRLHTVVLELAADGTEHRIRRRIGIREMSVDGDQLRLNGEAVTLRGVDWRECHPDHGIAIPPALTRRDAERLREANVNYVRTGHHPTTEHFVAACDELGIVIEMEAPLAGIRFGRTNVADDPSYRELVCRQILETVARDRNRTSVCLWSLANESEWGPNFEAAARLVADRDPTRPTTFNWGMYLDDDVGLVDVANHHYPAMRDSRVDLEAFANLDRPILFGEFCHLYCYNGEELGSDPGLRDDYERVFERAWERVCELDAFAGAAIWAGLDHPDPEYRWGILDGRRRRRPEYWHVKKTYAPIQLADVEWETAGVSVEFENRMTFANLDERTVEWSVGDASGTLDVAAEPGETVAVRLPASAVQPADEVHLLVRHPDGFVINEWRLEPDAKIRAAAGRSTGSGGRLTRAPRYQIGSAASEEGRPPTRGRTSSTPADSDTDAAPTDVRMEETEAHVWLASGGAVCAVDTYVGAVTLAGPDARDSPLEAVDPVLVGIPAVVVSTLQPEIDSPPRYVGTRSARLHPWRCEDVRLRDDGVEIVGGYYYDTLDVGHGSIRIAPAGPDAFEIAYEMTLAEDREAREVGLAVEVPRDMDRFAWDRDARWSAYPDTHIGRPTGSAIPFPGGVAPTDDRMRLDGSRSWSRDATRHGSNDFRSTKRHVRTASLSAPDGRALEVHCGGDQHVRCAVRGDAIDLNVLDASLAGSGLALLDRHDLLGEDPTIESGTTLSGSAVLRVATGDGR